MLKFVIVALVALASPSFALLPAGTSTDPLSVHQVISNSSVKTATATVTGPGYTRLVIASAIPNGAQIDQFGVTCATATSVGAAFAFASSDNLPTSILSSTKTVSQAGSQYISPFVPYGIISSSAGASLGLNLAGAGPCAIDMVYEVK